MTAPNGAVPPDFAEKLLRVNGLVTAMCNAPNDIQALHEASNLCCALFPDVCNVSMAVLTKDGQSLRYHKLSNVGTSQSYLGIMPARGTAAGLSMDLKEVVRTGNFRHSNLAFTDWRHISVEDDARSFVAAPLILCDKAVGALMIASLSEFAFTGYEPVVEVVVAVIAPHLGLQRFIQELKAVEGFVHQMVPTRVAARLLDLQVQSARAHPQHHHHHYPQQSNAGAAAAGAGSSASTAAGGAVAGPGVATAAATAHAASTSGVSPQQQQQQQPRHHQHPVQHNPQQQHNRQQQQDAGPSSTGTAPARGIAEVVPTKPPEPPPRAPDASQVPSSAQRGHTRGLPRHQRRAGHIRGASPDVTARVTPRAPRLSLFHTFTQRAAERSYLGSAYYSWQLQLDVVYVCLVAACTLGIGCWDGLGSSSDTAGGGGGGGGGGSSGMWKLLGGSGVCLAMAMAMLLCRAWRRLPLRLVLRYRERLLVGVRLIKLALFNYHFFYLANGELGTGAALTPADEAAVDNVGFGASGDATAGNFLSPLQLNWLELAASSGALLLLVHAMLGQLRLCVHVPVQWLACMAAAVAVTRNAGSDIRRVALAITLQLLLGFILPTGVLLLIEARARATYTRKRK